MKRVFPYLLFCLVSNLVKSQSPQFAVVSPSGTTYICPTLDSAYNKSVNGDYIYLPAGMFSLNQSIKKQLHLFGAGINPDSSIGITIINSPLTLGIGSDYSYIEGIRFTSRNYYGLGVFLGDGADGVLQNITFQRCQFEGAIALGSIVITVQNIFFNECVISGVAGGALIGNGSGGTTYNQTSSNWGFSKCIMNAISNFEYCTFNNNIVGISGNCAIGNVKSCTFSNNIFAGNFFGGEAPYFSIFDCSFTNNVNTNIRNENQNFINSDFKIDWSSIFTNANSDSVFKSNYHLKPGNPAINGGTDGTDVGIFGTSAPAIDGWIPSNPHIYFKKVGEQTDTTGHLKVEFRVRTN